MTTIITGVLAIVCLVLFMMRRRSRMAAEEE
jgi:hypothetical protein